MNDSTPMFSAHARPNRAVRRFALSRRRQRKAQALILAVLVMLMVAVLSAGFLLVVSGNLNQTARVTDKTRAVEAARSGLKFVNEQLTYSQLGENWRPGFIPSDTVNPNSPALTAQEQNYLQEGESLIPRQNLDSSFDLYYSSVDKANNWSGSFAKFPNPLDARSDAPQYLARVQRVASANPTNDPNITDPTDPDSQDPGKIGMLKITVIGLSNDDPAAFSKVVAYKGGQSSPIGRYMQTVTNWDFKNNVVPSATVVSYDATTDPTKPKLTLNNVRGVFPTQGQINNAPFTVMIGNATVTKPLRGAVVQSVSADGTVLTLAAAPATPPVADERVELAAQIGASLGIGANAPTNNSSINYNNDPAAASYVNTALNISAGNAPGSVFVLGSALMMGTVNAYNLQGQSTQALSNIEVTGLVARDAATSPAVNIAGVTQSGAVIPTASAKQLAASSNDANFPLGAADNNDDDSLVKDGFNRLNNAPSSLRQTKPATPPDISSAAGAGRYRQLTRDSKSTVSGASNYGYGEGIYINNPSDRERVYDGTKLRDMTQKELMQMWLSRKADNTDDTSVRFCRASSTTTTPPIAAITDTTASLEEQHLRGWVGPDEFHARGALVELFNDANDGNKAKVAITLDSRDDNPTTPNGAFGNVDKKAWKKVANGTPDTGVYRKVLDWPANGVVFAEGNVRVRGTLDTTLGDAPRSLTIVSQNNIYIDGSLNAGTKKVLLLARKNVVANPTQAVYRPDVQTVAKQDSTLVAGTATSVTVGDSSAFKSGDVIETATATTPANPITVSVVQSVPDAATLNVLPIQGGSISGTNQDIVRSRSDNVVNGRPVIASTTDVIQRRLEVSATANVRLSFYHNADRVIAASIETEAVSGGTKPSGAFAFLSNKKTAAMTATTIATTDKRFEGDYTQPIPAGSDFFPNPVHSTEAAATSYDLTALKTAMEGTTHTDGGTPPVAWHYKVTPQAAVPATTPAFYLAAFGNRYDYGLSVPTGTPDYRKDISTTAYNVPLATSISAFLSNVTINPSAPVALPGFGTPSTSAVTHFGFDPLYTPATSAEDVTTNDQDFYQGTTTGGVPDAAAQNATLDSRLISGAVTGQNSLVLRTSPGIVAGVTLPIYRSGNMKLESVDVTANKITPGFTMSINAFVYAQTGSWFVIPAAPSDLLVKDVLKLRGDEKKSYFDLNGDGLPTYNATVKEFVSVDGSGVFKDGDCADLNRNGVCDPGEAQAYLRYSRANYQINFKGAIAENQTAIVNPVGTVPGSVQAWMNSWASYDVTTGTLSNQQPGVTYTFDPSYATNPASMDAGFVMPQSEELTYVE